jgi:prevent-host-death family protein
MEVDIRDLRKHLSNYLARVAQGDRLVVTDRGQPVVRILPIDVPQTIDRLTAAGLVYRASGLPRSRPVRRIKTKGPMSELIAEQRR